MTHSYIYSHQHSRYIPVTTVLSFPATYITDVEVDGVIYEIWKIKNGELIGRMIYE